MENRKEPESSGTSNLCKWWQYHLCKNKCRFDVVQISCFRIKKIVVQNNSLAGNIPVIKNPLSFCGCGREGGGRREEEGEEERWEHSVQFGGSCYERIVRHITFKRVKVGRRVC